MLLIHWTGGRHTEVRVPHVKTGRYSPEGDRARSPIGSALWRVRRTTNVADFGVGAIGMCFTGNFALTMMLEPSMVAPVLSQPPLPMEDFGGLEIAPEEIAAVRQRLDREDLTVLAYRFQGDRFCRAERFTAYAAALGDRLIARELPDSAANTDVAPFFADFVACPHSVVTQHLVDADGQPTVAARDEILAFFATRLLAKA